MVYYITCFVKLEVLFIFSCGKFEDYVLSCNMLILDTGVYIFIDYLSYKVFNLRAVSAYLYGFSEYNN